MVAATFRQASRDAVPARLDAKRWAVSAVLTLAALLALLWPALLNGQPFFFPDTTAYIRGAAFPIEKVLGAKTAWSIAATAADTKTTSPAPAPKVASVSSVEDKAVLAGRSVYYGALLLLGHLSGGFWLSVLAQALVISAGVYMAARRYIPDPARAAALALVVLGVATPLPWFAGYLMPDVFAGLTILSVAMLLSARSTTTPREDAFWFVVLGYALLCHSSHVLIAGALLVTAAIATLAFRPLRQLRGFALATLAIIVALAGEFAFSAAVTKVTGASPIRPPFLTARVAASDHGAAYLKSVCPQAGYAVCAYADRLPLNHNAFLWSQDPSTGVFVTAEPTVRRALGAEQLRVYLGVWLYDPIAQGRAVVTQWLGLLPQTGLVEFNYSETDRQFFAKKVPADTLIQMQTTPSWRGTWSFEPLSLLNQLALGISALALLVLFVRGRTTAGDAETLAALVTIGVMLNALICGALSGVEARYQARVIWLIPLMAMLLLTVHRHRSNAQR